MSRPRKLPPRRVHTAVCRWDGTGCGWTTRLPEPEATQALIDHARDTHYGTGEHVAAQANSDKG